MKNLVAVQEKRSCFMTPFKYMIQDLHWHSNFSQQFPCSWFQISFNKTLVIILSTTKINF